MNLKAYDLTVKWNAQKKEWCRSTATQNVLRQIFSQTAAVEWQYNHKSGISRYKAAVQALKADRNNAFLIVDGMPEALLKTLFYRAHHNRTTRVISPANSLQFSFTLKHAHGLEPVPEEVEVLKLKTLENQLLRSESEEIAELEQQAYEILGEICEVAPDDKDYIIRFADMYADLYDVSASLPQARSTETPVRRWQDKQGEEHVLGVKATAYPKPLPERQHFAQYLLIYALIRVQMYYDIEPMAQDPNVLHAGRLIDYVGVGEDGRYYLDAVEALA